MACGNTTGATQKRLNAYSSTPAQEWFSPWMLAVGVDDIMPVMKARAASNNHFRAQLIIQTANVRTDAPNAVVQLGAVQSASGGGFDYNPGMLNVATQTDGAMYVRFGVEYNYVSGQSQSSADVELEVAYVQCGKLAGTGTFQLSTTTVDDQFMAVTGWMLGVLVQEVRAALVCNSLTGNFRFRLAYRTAATSKEAPSAWNTVTDANAPYTAGEFNTRDLAVTVGANMWIQFAILYDLSSAGTGQASVSAAVAIRRT